MATVVLLLSTDTPPWSRPGDWVDAGHTVELVGCGGRGAQGNKGANSKPVGGGGGGAYQLLTYSSGTLGSTTPFAVLAFNTSTTDHTSVATLWENDTFAGSNLYYAEAGTASGVSSPGGGGLVGGIQGSPSVIYTASAVNGGGTGGQQSFAVNFAGSGGGGASGSPDGAGGDGGRGITNTPTGGGGGGGTNGHTPTDTSTTTGGNGGDGSAGTGHGTGSSSASSPNGSNGSNGGGGGGGAGSATNSTGLVGSGYVGGSLGNQTDWTDNSGGANNGVTAGAGGGGGGGGGLSANQTNTSNGVNGASYGSGGGGGGPCRGNSSTNNPGEGSPGIIAVTYQTSTVKSGEATFGGVGTQSASAVQRQVAVASFAGAGGFSARPISSQKAAATFAGVGSFSASIVTRLIGTAWFTTPPATNLLHFDGSNGSTAFLDSASHQNDPATALLHFDGADTSTTITDSGTGGNTWTAVGNAQLTTADSVFGISCATFDGSGDYIRGNGSSDFAFGTGDFTIDLWWKAAVLGGDNLYDGTTVDGDIAPVIAIGPDNKLHFRTGGADRINSDSTVSAGVWYHTAITRTSGTTRMFINGQVQTSTYADSNDYVIFANRPVIGCYGTLSGGFLQGWIDELRVVKGQALWTDSFTPPIKPYLVIPLASHTWTANGNAQLDTAQSKFGPTSLKLDGTLGTFVNGDGSSDLAFGGGDFTIDFWVRNGFDGTQATLLDLADAVASPILEIYLSATANVVKLSVGHVDKIIGSTSISTGAWHHVAITRYQRQTRLFVDGIQEGSTYNDTNVYAVGTNRPTIGCDGETTSSTRFNGWIDELRILKGRAIWTSNFTPPVAPSVPNGTFSVDASKVLAPITGEARFAGAGSLSAITKSNLAAATNFGVGTDLATSLLHFDGANGSTSFPDSGTASPAHTWTAVGNAQLDTSQSKFGSASLSIPANGDYVLGDGSSDFAFGTGDFTVDFWVRPSYVAPPADFALIWDCRTADGPSPLLYVVPGVGTVRYFLNAGDQISGTTVLQQNTWYHVALTRSGTSTRLFINGTQEGGTFVDSTSLTVGANRPVLCSRGLALGTQGFFGNLEELRVVKGTAVWISNFTPPTVPYSTVSGGALRADSKQNRTGSVTFAGVGGLSASVNSGLRAAATFAGSGTENADAVKPANVQFAAATFAGVGAFRADISFITRILVSWVEVEAPSSQPTNIKFGAATFAGLGTFAATITSQGLAAAGNFSGVGSLSAAAQLTRPAAATFAGFGTLQVDTQHSRAALATFIGIGNGTVAATLNEGAAATFAGTSTFSADAIQAGIKTGEVTFIGVDNLSASAQANLAAAIILNGVSNVSASSNVVHTAVAIFAGTSSLTALTNKVQQLLATLAGAGLLSGRATLAQGVSVSFAGVGAQADSGQLNEAALLSWAGIGSLSVRLNYVNLGSAIFVGTGSLTLSATVNELAAATFAGAGNLSATALLNELAYATFSGQSTQLALAIHYKPTAVTFTGTSTLVSSTQLNEAASARLPGISTLSIATTQTHQAVATFAGISSLSVEAVQAGIHIGAVVFAGAGLLSAATIQSARAATTFAGQGTMQALAALITGISATFTGSGALSASTTAGLAARATFVGQSSLSVDVIQAAVRFGAATFTGTSTLSTLAQLNVAALAQFAGVGTLAADSFKTQPIAATFSGTSNLSVLSMINGLIATTFVGQSTLSVDTIQSHGAFAEATFAGQGNLSTLARAQMVAQVQFSGVGSLQIAPWQRGVLAATLSGAGNLNALAAIRAPIAANFAGQSLLSVGTLATTRLASVTFAGTSTASVLARLNEAVQVALTGAGQLSVTISRQVHKAAATFAGVSDFSIAVEKAGVRDGAVNWTGVGIMSAAVTLSTPAFINLTGAGNFRVQPQLNQSVSAVFTGVGNLAVDTVYIKGLILGEGLFGGQSDLRAEATQQMFIEAVFAGAGNLRVKPFFFLESLVCASIDAFALLGATPEARPALTGTGATQTTTTSGPAAHPAVDTTIQTKVC